MEKEQEKEQPINEDHGNVQEEIQTIAVPRLIEIKLTHHQAKLMIDALNTVRFDGQIGNASAIFGYVQDIVQAQQKIQEGIDKWLYK